MRHHEWHTAIGLDGGWVVHSSSPWWAWVLDRLLDHHPHWEWLDRLSPGYGNPLCAAYCIGWTRVMSRVERNEHWYKVTYDALDEWQREEWSDMHARHAHDYEAADARNEDAGASEGQHA